MNLSQYSVQRPVTVIILFALLVLISAVMVPQIGVDLFPEVEMPVISVSTSYTGAGPEDVEENVTEPLENLLVSVKGLENIRSTSSYESSRIMLEFGYDVDLDTAKQDVESVLSRAGSVLPDDADDPTVFQFDMSAMPIMRLVVKGDYPIEELKQIAEDTLQPELERIEGVASTSISGGSEKIVDVSVSGNRLAAFDLSLYDIVSVLSSENVLIGGGTMVRGSTEYQLITQEELTSIDEVREVIIKATAVTDASKSVTRMVRLGDVADVEYAYDDSDIQVLVDDVPALYIQIQSESDSNSVQVSNMVRSSMDDINAELPNGVTLEVLSDDTTMIRSTLNQVYSAALQGALLAMVILLFFLRSIKGTFIIGLSIPISILITLMFMAFFDLTLNLITLTGLVLGLGMIVDGSIVILENIHVYRERGTKPAIAAILGSEEMYRAIVASTLTTLCVFIPVILFKNQLEMMGEMFGDLVFTVVISLVVSLAVAVIVVPALAGPIMRLNTRVQKPLKNRFVRGIDEAIESGLKTMENGYRQALDYCLSHRALVILLVLVILAFSLAQAGNMGMNLFVRGTSDDRVDISITLPAGTEIEETQTVLEKLSNAIEEKVNGYENIVVTAGSGGMRFFGSSSGNTGSIQIILPPPEEQIDTPAVIKEKISDDMTMIPGAQVEFSAGRRMGSSSAVDVEIVSDSMDLAMETAEEVRLILNQYLPEAEDPVISLETGGPQLRFDIDKERAKLLGISAGNIAKEIKIAVNGSTAAVLSEDGDDIDIVVALDDDEIGSLPDLRALSLTNQAGVRVPLDNLAEIVETTAPSDIEREDRQRIIHVTSDLAAGIAVTDMEEVVHDTIEAHLVPRDGVEISYGGEAADVRQYGTSFLYIIAAAVILVFGIMASQFESFVDPFIIFFSIPLLFIGVIWIYIISGEPFSLFSAVGVVALVGIVVNNGIVLVDYTNTLRSRGMRVREACLAAGRSRLRPIMMTTLTTILGMVPLAFFPGEGAETIQPIGKTIVGGLAAGSLMTMFVTPVMYSVLNRRHDLKRARSKGRLAEAEAAGANLV